ncbi:dephospho-CoA kinase [uncultured Bifidobacterium sp.]|nr:dephospho-CoA kinase [uncultured Bifidobacterium sp.]
MTNGDGHMIRVGLTGGIAAGKSTVAARFRELGVSVVDYDDLARAVVAPGGEGLRRIVEEFGERAVGADGTLDRAWMADHVFGADAAPGARERLDAIEHPLIYQEAERIEQRLAGTGEGRRADPLIVVHDVPLLAEVIDAMPFRFDHIVTVEAPVETRVARMIATRGMTRDQALARIGSQSTRAEREVIADVVIDSEQPFEQMFDAVDMLVAQWRSDCGNTSRRAVEQEA